MPENNPVMRSSAPLSWLFKMAWRDSRKNRARLFLFTSSIILGIAALVAVYSFRDNLQRDIDDQAKNLTGADLIIDSRKPVEQSATAMLDTLGDERAKQLDFASMLYFLKGQGSRLVQIKALEGNYPFYGEIETQPASAGKTFTNGRNALVDRTVMLQYKAKPGDSIKVGKLNFAIAGYLDNSPGQTGLSATVAPVVFIPLKYLSQTGLAQFGSRIHYSYFYKFNNSAALPAVIKRIQPVLDREGLDLETVASKKQNTGRSFQDLNRFLALSGFVALLLGCVGVGSAIHVYVNEKIAAVSTLRCLGVKAWDAFFIYLIQITFIGLAGAIAGAVLGTGIQFLMPLVLQDFLPVEFTMQISWLSILQGIITGVIIAVLFALPSLLAVRSISPLNAIRLAVEPVKAGKEPLKYLVYALILLFILGFSYLQMESLMQALVFTGGLLLAVLIFYGFSLLLLFLVRIALPQGLSYVWRQGFSNLYRPNNQTLMLIVSIGLATALISTLYFVQGILVKRVTLSSGKNQPNMVLFDIQTDQVQAVNELTKKFKLPLMNQVPVITMRIEAINGQTATQLAEADSLAARKNNGGDRAAAVAKEGSRNAGDRTGQQSSPSGRAFKGEIRASYQDKLTEAETLTEGKWVGRLKSPTDSVYISLDERYAESIHVKLGDKILFNVQGMMIPTVVSSFRKVNWARMQANFRVVFPKGILEDAPQFHVLMTRVPDARASARYQSEVVTGFPNVSLIDLGLVLKVLDELLGKISFVIRFMASFSMITGWIVLISAVRSSKNQRLRETVLLRTMGAKSSQVLTITAIEYLFLGLLSAAAGMIVAIAGSWALAVYSFGTDFSPAIGPVLLLPLSVILIVVITGVWSSRAILKQSPLEVLRKDS